MFAGGAPPPRAPAPPRLPAAAGWPPGAAPCGARVGTSPPRFASPPRPAPPPPRPAPPPPPRGGGVGGGPSGTRTALVIAASDSLRVASFSHGVAATAPSSMNAILPNIGASYSKRREFSTNGPHAITQVQLDPLL